MGSTEWYRWVWTIASALFSLIASWNAKEAAIDHWHALTARPNSLEKIENLEALRLETAGSAWVQTLVFLALVSGFLAGLFSFWSLPIPALIALFALDLFLGVLTIVEAQRRLKVKQALRAKLDLDSGGE